MVVQWFYGDLTTCRKYKIPLNKSKQVMMVSSLIYLRLQTMASYLGIWTLKFQGVYIPED